MSLPRRHNTGMSAAPFVCPLLTLHSSHSMRHKLCTCTIKLLTTHSSHEYFMLTVNNATSSQMKQLFLRWDIMVLLSRGFSLSVCHIDLMPMNEHTSSIDIFYICITGICSSTVIFLR